MKKNLFGVSMMTMAILYGILAIIVIPLGIAAGLSLVASIFLSIVMVILQFLISPVLTDLSMKWFYRANFDMEMPPYLRAFIENVCAEHNMKYPKIGYIDDGAPNAFTYGHTKNDARIVLTRGLFELLSEDEVKAVVAHEMGHAVHYDMLFMTFAQLVPLILYWIYALFAEGNNSNDKDNSATAAIGYIAYLLYVICQYIVLKLSRTREYYADYFSAIKLRNPNLLASALVKIGYGLSASTNRQGRLSVSSKNTLGIFDAKSSEALIISSYNNGEVSKENIKNAMKWEMWNVWAKWYELNSTHPLISKRLQELSKLSEQYGLEPYVKFDLKRPESFVDDFIVEVFMKCLPFIIIILIAVLTIFVDSNSMMLFVSFMLTLFFTSIGLLFYKRHPKGYTNTNVSNLLGLVKVSDVTAVPCILNGTIIGRGDPGCVLNEDFVIRDDTGIMLLDYKQPLVIINKVFAIFKSKEYIGKNVTITGWYRRNSVPYVEIYSINIDGKTKKCYSYGLSKVSFWIFMIISIIFLLFSIFSYFEVFM